MSLIEVLQKPQDTVYGRDLLAGPVIGIVTNNQDPDGLARVKVKFPWLSEDHESDWARVCTPMAGPRRGLFFLPEVDDEVLVVFEQADVRKPVVLGGLWNGVDSPPESNEDGKNNLRVIQSRNEHRIVFDDGEDKVEIVDKERKNSIVIDVAKGTITVTADADVAIDAPNGKVKISCKDLELSATGDAKLKAGGSMQGEAGSQLTLKGTTINLN